MQEDTGKDVPEKDHKKGVKEVMRGQEVLDGVYL